MTTCAGRGWRSCCCYCFGTIALVQAEADIDAFLAAPVGRYLRGDSFLLWVHSPSLLGASYPGLPSGADLMRLGRTLGLPLSPALAPRFDAVVDVAGVSHVSPEAFALIAGHLQQDVTALAARVRRVAVVRPAGMSGATVTGLFYEHLAPSIAGALFSDAREAFAWLDRPEGAAVAVELAALEAELFGLSPLLRALREQLAGTLAGPRIEPTARALGVSVRSLQRALAAAGSSFRGEVARARVRAAEILLMGERKLESIAREVGCASLAQFSTLFRRLTGETPSEFRARRLSADRRS